MFPPCQHEGHVKPGERRYCRLPAPKPPVLVSLQKCLTCPHAGNFAKRLEPICTPIDEVSPCIHRGDQIRTETITTGCCGSEAVPVLACHKYRECTLERRTNHIHSCDGCIHQQATDLPPLTGPANLIWFVWPRRETREVWERQQEYIREAIGRFDGLKFCYIATDESTEAERIDRHLWDQYCEQPNIPELREMQGWRPMMSRVVALPGFTVWLHAKGVHRHQDEQHLQAWTDLAYERMLDVKRVRAALETNIVAGVFRRSVRCGNLGVPWHFAGSFYAFRNDAVFSRDWVPPCTVNPGWYAESWPALIAKHEEAACIGWDGVGDLYQARNWREVPCK